MTTFEFNFDAQGQGDDVDRLLEKFEDAKNWEVVRHYQTFVSGPVSIRVSYSFEWEQYSGEMRNYIPVKVEATVRQRVNRYREMTPEDKETAKALLLHTIHRSLQTLAGFAPTETTEWHAKVQFKFQGTDRKAVVPVVNLQIYLDPSRIKVLLVREQLKALARDVRLSVKSWAETIKS